MVDKLVGKNRLLRCRWRALDIRVIAVAKEGFVHDWAAYIGAVEGNNHEEEWKKFLNMVQSFRVILQKSYFQISQI